MGPRVALFSLQLLITPRPDDVPLLISHLETGRLKKFVIEILGRAGSDAADALPALYELLESTENEKGREIIEEAISKIESDLPDID